MKYKIALLLIYFAFNCQSQNSEFNEYLSHFGRCEIPLEIEDRVSFCKIFCQAYDTLFHRKTPLQIKKEFIDKFICKDDYCNSDPVLFRYDYGVLLDFNKNFITLLVSKLKFEGNSIEDFDLRESILITYDFNGNILSRSSITKDNDIYKSSLRIYENSIEVGQIRILEFNKPERKCELETSFYEVRNDGEIICSGREPIRNEIVVWDDEIEDFRLK